MLRKLISTIKRAPKRTSALLAILVAAIIVPATLFAWGPSRPTYTIEHPADHVTFNSITNNPAHGDERNFVQVREANASNSTYADGIRLIPGHDYVVFMYYHNNASSSLNASGVGIAHDAYVRAELPAVVRNGSNGTNAVGYVGASNASPTIVWDEISLSNYSGGDIALRYIPGSATIHNRGRTNGMRLSDNIIRSNGAYIGYDSLNGIVPGCEPYSGYVTFSFRADQPNFTVSKQARISGTTTWHESVSADPDENVDFLITYRNTGSTVQNNVVARDTLPRGMSYVAGTTYVVNSTNPGGIRVSDNIVTSSGINIGNYGAGAAAYIKFSARIAANDNLPICGINTLNNVATVSTNNGSKSDNSTVTVTRICTPPTPPTPPVPPTPVVPSTPPELPVTGPVEDIGALMGLGSLTASVGYYQASRRRRS